MSAATVSSATAPLPLPRSRHGGGRSGSAWRLLRQKPLVPIRRADPRSCLLDVPVPALRRRRTPCGGLHGHLVRLSLHRHSFECCPRSVEQLGADPARATRELGLNRGECLGRKLDASEQLGNRLSLLGLAGRYPVGTHERMSEVCIDRRERSGSALERREGASAQKRPRPSLSMPSAGDRSEATRCTSSPEDATGRLAGKPTRHSRLRSLARRVTRGAA